MTGIAGKVVAITGASSGIGEATARLLAERGAAVVLGARRGSRLDDLAGEIRAAGGRVVTATTDVTQRADVEALVACAVDKFGRLDVLVSNAGIGKIGPVRPQAAPDHANGSAGCCCAAGASPAVAGCCRAAAWARRARPHCAGGAAPPPHLGPRHVQAAEFGPTCSPVVSCSSTVA